MNFKHLCIILNILIFISFVSANPLITPQTKKTNQKESEQPKIEKQFNPVRIFGGSQNLFQIQGDLRDQLAKVFTQLSDNSNNSLHDHLRLFIFILAVSFFYGILHAAGPGHRKTVLFSLYLTRESPSWEPAFVAFILALLHGGAAVAIMFIFKGIAGSVTANTSNLTVFMEGFSYVILIAATFFLIGEAIHSYLKTIKTKTVHNNQSSTKTVQLLPFIISGIYPCPGAILIMVLCFTLHVFQLGVFSVLAMSIGMSIPIMAAAYLAWTGRTGLFRLLKNNEKAAAKIAFIIEISGYTLLLLFSLYISWPFLLSFF